MSGSGRRSWASGIIPREAAAHSLSLSAKRGRDREGAAALSDQYRHLASQPRQKPRHVARSQRDAAGGGRKLTCRDVKENRAAAPARAGTKIVIQHPDGVIERVPAPHPFMAKARRPMKRLVVKERARVVAPDVARPRAPPWQAQRDWRAQVKVKERPAAGRSRAIAFAFATRDSVAAQRTGKNQSAGDQPTLMRAPADAPRDAQQIEFCRFRPH